MPSDYLDYENNLAFAPKSADDLNEQKRESEVLIAALEKCEKLEKQLKIAIDCLEKYADTKSWDLRPAYGGDCAIWDSDEYGYPLAEIALMQIKELDK